jgi:hypothetical protein
MIGDVPLVDTPRKSTVTRFTQDGMPVKSIAVPDVDACAVIITIGRNSVVNPLAVTDPLLCIPVVPSIITVILNS